MIIDMINYNTKNKVNKQMRASYGGKISISPFSAAQDRIIYCSFLQF